MEPPKRGSVENAVRVPQLDYENTKVQLRRKARRAGATSIWRSARNILKDGLVPPGRHGSCLTCMVAVQQVNNHLWPLTGSAKVKLSASWSGVRVWHHNVGSGFRQGRCKALRFRSK